MSKVHPHRAHFLGLRLKAAMRNMHTPEFGADAIEGFLARREVCLSSKANSDSKILRALHGSTTPTPGYSREKLRPFGGWSVRENSVTQGKARLTQKP